MPGACLIPEEGGQTQRLERRSTKRHRNVLHTNKIATRAAGMTPRNAGRRDNSYGQGGRFTSNHRLEEFLQLADERGLGRDGRICTSDEEAWRRQRRCHSPGLIKDAVITPLCSKKKHSSRKVRNHLHRNHQRMQAFIRNVWSEERKWRVRCRYPHTVMPQN